MTRELRKQAQELVAQMTLEEKASLCSGKNFWESKAVERLGIKSFMLTDGPHGLRKQAGAAVVMLGLPDSFESEGFDRAHMNLPENQNRLIEALVKTGTPIVAVLSTGGAALLPWRERVDSILLMYLGGQNSGSAVADLLLGKANPCGKLAETWPLALEDTPCHGFFGNGGNVEYRESIYVGYRYYDKAKKEVAYPFGHGLSYTDFDYTGLTLSHTELDEKNKLTVRVTVKNTGALAGKEVVQLYVAPPADGMFRPVRELRAYAKMELAPGESKTVELTLSRRAFAYYGTQTKDWRVGGGTYTVEAGSSSRDIRLTQAVDVRGAVHDTTMNGRVPAYCDPAKQWPVSKEQFEIVLGHPVPPELSLRPFTTNSTLTRFKPALWDVFSSSRSRPIWPGPWVAAREWRNFPRSLMPCWRICPCGS